MTKRYTILQKKLKQLESELNQVFALSPEIPYHQRVSQDVQQRFLFLKNLLSAEIASRPRKPYHLQHIAERLSELEAAFQEWDSFQTSAPDHVEEGSTCSCTDSCLNDDGEAADGNSPELSFEALEEAAKASTKVSLFAGLNLEGLVDHDEKAVPLPVTVTEENLQETSIVMEADHDQKEEIINKEESVWGDNQEEENNINGRMAKEEMMIGVRFGKYLGTLASGVAIGMVLSAFFMVTLSGIESETGCFLHASDYYTFSLNPT